MKKTIIAFIALACATTSLAQTQDGYFKGRNFVSYNDSLMAGSDVATFQILGHGYAKDSKHVYLNGHILDYADPSTFKLTDNAPVPVATTQPKEAETTNTEKKDDEKPSLLDIVLGTDETESRYAVDGDKVTYDGTTIKKADAKTFKYVGGEYAADKHHAYYKGKILGNAWGIGQFKYRGNGYASDGIHWYCNGKEVDRD